MQHVQKAQGILGSYKVVAASGDQPAEILDSSANILKNHVWHAKNYSLSTRIATSALFTYLSPKTRQPLGFNCNHRRTMKDAVMEQSSKHKRPYNEVLQELDVEDSVSITSNRQTYFLVTTLSHQPGYDSEKKAAKDQPDDDFSHMRSMTHLYFDDEDNVGRTLLLSDHGIRNPSVDAVNQLLFLLGVEPFCTSIKQNDVDMNLVFMEHLFDKFEGMRLEDPAEMKKWIKTELGFDFSAADESTPIWKQWTMLSFFLQMCSPITFSALDGGHRTWAIISFLTGKPLSTMALDRNYGELFNPNDKTIHPR